MMKKILMILLSAAILASSAACQGQNGSSSGSSVPASSGGSTSVGSSSAASGTSSSASFSSGVTSDTSSVTPAFQDTSRAPTVKAEASKNDGNYKIKSVDYTLKKDNNDYSVSYPQLTGLASQQDKVNAAIKNCALKTVNSLGTGAKKVKTKVKTTGDATYQGKTFISVGFNEYVTLSPKGKTTHALRTVNLNLSTGAVLSFSDLIKGNDSFYAALAKDAKAQFSSEYASESTASALKKNLDKNSMYFTESGVGFAVTSQSKLLRVTIGYNEIKPFISNNAVWKNFI